MTICNVPVSILTSFNGTEIIYDAIGNPIGYYNGYTFTWSGRQLTRAVTGNRIYTFTYNDNGIRTSKTVNGVTTNYYLNGSQIIAEEVSGNVKVFLYDSTGAPIGMQYHKATDAEDVWEVYWFEKNLFGDIIAVYSSNATKLVSYSYDAWGYFKTTYHNGGASTQAARNPFRYRGYYYDLDLGLYYLNSRYYDCNTGRFINADKFVSTGQGFTGYNMFAYCNNNPISYVDSEGELAAEALTGWLTGGGAIAVAEPSFIGEIILIVGAALIVVFSTVHEYISLSKDVTNTSESVEEPDNTPELDENGKPVVKPGQQPTEKDGYIPPKGGPVKGKTPDGRIGWKDKNGNIWVPAPTGTSSGHGGGHWDVQSPKGGYTNVYPGGSTRGGKAPYPNIKIYP